MSYIFVSLSSAMYIKRLNIVTGEGSWNLRFQEPSPFGMLIPEVPGIFSSYYVESHTNCVQIVSLYKDSQFVHNLYEMPYRSNKSPLCGLTPTSMHSYMHA